MNLWAPVDAQTKWVRGFLNKGRLERLSVVMFDFGVLFLFYLPFTDEPPLVFFMSALALLFSGLIALIDANIEEIKNDDSC